MKKILFTLLLTFACLNISAQTKGVQQKEYFVYTGFMYPHIYVNSTVVTAPIFKLTKAGHWNVVTENGKAVLFTSGLAVRNYLNLYGWVQCNDGNVNIYKKKVTKKELENEVNKTKSFATCEDVIEAFYRDTKKYSSLAGYNLGTKFDGSEELTE